MIRSSLRAVALCVSVGVIVGASGRGVPLGLDLYRPAPGANPLTPAKIALGRRLFHERRLSFNASLSCAGCHDPRRAFTNAHSRARGANGVVGNRNVPTLVNRAWGSSYFWDGRALTLEQQALGPLLNANELAGTPDGVVALARSSDYRQQFLAAFGDEPDLFDVAAALASYVRTIMSGDAPVDRFLAGDRRALGEAARRGLVLFRAKAHCSTCHAGPLFSDEQFHNTGVAWRTGILTDVGRYQVTRASADRAAFKTPTLREISRTAPYMHDGSSATLDAVVDFYDAGGGRNAGLDPEIRPLNLSTAEKKDLIAFLGSLTGRIREGT